MMFWPLPGQGLPLGQARANTHAALLMFSLYAHLRSCVQSGLDAGAHVKTKGLRLRAVQLRRRPRKEQTQPG